MLAPPRLVPPPRASFDVICAGEPLRRPASLRNGDLTAGSLSLFAVARALAQTELRVGLAAVVDDDRFGRASIAQLAAQGVDVRGVMLASSASLVVVDAVGGHVEVTADAHRARDLAIPEGWSSRVLLLSGLAPITSRAAASCKAARRARRDGSVVLLDVTGSLRQWAGRDPRMIAMIIREADVVRCSLLDLALIGADAPLVRSALRPGATLIVGDDAGTSVSGPLGEARVRTKPGVNEDAAEEQIVAICAELARPERAGESGESIEGRWARVLGCAKAQFRRSIG